MVFTAPAPGVKLMIRQAATRESQRVRVIDNHPRVGVAAAEIC
ncbi:hypothetical protein GCM10023352_09310 [Rothia endophytica]|uniref:Uncharacterized protein n=1 Tax=Rothia endophytica TaxID=1324766 RepID=A0ABP9BAI3_9MICC